MSLDYNTVIYACLYSVLGAIIAGLFGFFIGKILETANNSNKKNNYRHSKKFAGKESDDNEDT
ncbi:MAG: hypothetical protein WCG23_03315 [bacterium]